MKKIVIGAGLLAIAAAAAYFWPSGRIAAEKAAEKRIEESRALEQALREEESVGRSPAAEMPLAEKPLDEGEKRSLGALVDLLSQGERVGQNPRALFDALGRAGLQPVAARDSNPHTGTMWTVRTDNALPGTRYFHAQLYGEDDTHMQHVSFELRPGADSMATAVDLVRQAHPHLGRPEIERDDYVLWKSDGRVVSVKRLSGEELRGNVFNAHAPEDEGTVWVVSEDDPEASEG